MPDGERYDKMNVHCDVLVVGGGPAGLSAALAAGRTGARVIVADQQSELGGGLLDLRDSAPVSDWSASLPDVAASSALEWLRNIVAEIAALPDVRVLTRSTVFGYHDHNFLTINQRLTDHLPPSERRGFRERVWRVRARQVVLATGAIERPLVFGNNDRPGVMLASAVSAFTNRYGVKLASRAVVFTNNDAAYRTVVDLLDAGIVVSAVVDARSTADSEWARRVRKMQVPVIANAAVVDVKGRKRVRAVKVMALDPTGASVAGAARMIDCDLLAVSGGFSPAVHLHAQSGGRPRFDEAKACFVPGTSEQDECSAGACQGTLSTNGCIAEGFAAGTKAALRAGFAGPPDGGRG